MISRKQVNEFKDKGFTVLKGFIEEKIVKSYKLELDQFIQKNYKNWNGRHINKTDTGIINSIHDMGEWERTKELQSSNKTREVAKVFLNDDPEDFGAELFAKPAKVGLSSPIHQDNFYWCIDDANAITMWIAMDKAGALNGGVYYYVGSHKLGLLEHKPSYAPGSSQTIKYPNLLESYQRELPELDPGDCIVHNTLVVHGSKDNESENDRRGWTIRYKSRSSKIDLQMKRSYEQSLAEQVESRG